MTEIKTGLPPLPKGTKVVNLYNELSQDDVVKKMLDGKPLVRGAVFEASLAKMRKSGRILSMARAAMLEDLLKFNNGSVEFIDLPISAYTVRMLYRSDKPISENLILKNQRSDGIKNHGYPNIHALMVALYLDGVTKFTRKKGYELTDVMMEFIREVAEEDRKVKETALRNSIMPKASPYVQLVFGPDNEAMEDEQFVLRRLYHSEVKEHTTNDLFYLLVDQSLEPDAMVIQTEFMKEILQKLRQHGIFTALGIVRDNQHLFGLSESYRLAVAETCH